MFRIPTYLLGAILAWNLYATMAESSEEGDAVKRNFDYSQFELIGSKLFIFEHYLYQSWTTAEKTCRRMGAHLAYIEDAEELAAVTSKMKRGKFYWLGINDRKKEGEFVTVQTGQKAPFLNWYRLRPARDELTNCVEFFIDRMNDQKCSDKDHFICQADE